MNSTKFIVLILSESSMPPIEKCRKNGIIFSIPKPTTGIYPAIIHKTTRFVQRQARMSVRTHGNPSMRGSGFRVPSGPADHLGRSAQTCVEAEKLPLPRNVRAASVLDLYVICQKQITYKFFIPFLPLRGCTGRFFIAPKSGLSSLIPVSYPPTTKVPPDPAWHHRR